MTKLVNLARTMNSKLKASQKHIKNERGATVIEYIGLCAVIVILIGLMISAFSGANLGQDIYNGIRGWLNDFFN